jgi:hypothetical protein
MTFNIRSRGPLRLVHHTDRDPHYLPELARELKRAKFTMAIRLIEKQQRGTKFLRREDHLPWARRSGTDNDRIMTTADTDRMLVESAMPRFDSVITEHTVVRADPAATFGPRKPSTS